MNTDLILRNPLNLYFDNLISDIDNIFPLRSRLFNASGVNMWEEKDGYHIEMAVPGFSKDDINIEINEDIITISGEVKDKVETKEENKDDRKMIISSLSYSCNQRIKLPGLVNVKKAEATVENGVLKIHLPKSKEFSAKIIPIK